MTITQAVTSIVTRLFRGAPQDEAESAVLARAVVDRQNRVVLDGDKLYQADATSRLAARGYIGIGDLPTKLKSYTVLTLPSAASYTGHLIYVSDETGGATVAVSNGSAWKRLQDLATVS